MKRFHKRNILWIAVAVVTGVAVVWWFWPREGEDFKNESVTLRPTKTAVERSSLPVAANPAGKPLPEWGTPEFNKTILERCAKWMESRGRDGASLIAMWDLAGDERLLLEAAEKFPDDPRVCAAMIGHLTAKGGDALPWAERLIANEPNNPAGHYHKADALGKAGRREEALEALRAAVKNGGKPEPHLRGRILTAREAVLAGGGSVKEAAQAALAGPFSKMGLPTFAGGALKVLREEMQEAKKVGDTERAVEAAALGAAAAEHQSYNTARTLMDDLVGNSILRLVLGELPPDMEYGNGEKTAGERLAEIEAEKAERLTLLKEAQISEDAMASLTDSQAAEYTDLVILHGEEAARRWLNELVRKRTNAEN